MIVKGAIFDMDGLMFDTERLFFEAFRQKIEPETGLSFPKEQLKRLLGLNHETGVRLFREMFPEANQAECYRMKYDWVAQYIEENGVPIKPGLFDLLNHLREKEIPIAVASSTGSDLVAPYMDRSGVRPYLTAIIGGEMVSRGKPEPDIFLAAAKALGQKPEECLVFEDSENGLLAAAAGGIPCVIVPDLVDPTTRHPGKYLCRLNTLAEAIPLLEE